MKRAKKNQRTWYDYEDGKAAIAARVAKSEKSGEEAAREYERQLKRLCRRLGL